MKTTTDKRDAELARLREALGQLLNAAETLHEQCTSCAVNHYGDDSLLHGLPAYLSETQSALEEARAALSQKEQNDD